MNAGDGSEEFIGSSRSGIFLINYFPNLNGRGEKQCIILKMARV